MANSYGGKCWSCEDGEHDDYTEDGERVILYDADDEQKIEKIGWICWDHLAMYIEDGRRIMGKLWTAKHGITFDTRGNEIDYLTR